MMNIISKHHKAGSEQITMYLHQDGEKINHKRVERLYTANKLQLKNRKTGRKKYSVKKREEHILTEAVGKWFAFDFVIDSIANKQLVQNSFSKTSFFKTRETDR